MSPKQQVVFALLAVIAMNAQALLQYKGNMRHPELANHCYYGEYDITTAFNETSYPTNLKDACIAVFCREDYVLEITHCSDASRNRGVNWGPYNYSKPFPDCCPVVTCNK